MGSSLRCALPEFFFRPQPYCQRKASRYSAGGGEQPPMQQQADKDQGDEQPEKKRGIGIFWHLENCQGARVDRGGADRFPAVGKQQTEEHTSELQSHVNLVCRLLLEKKKKTAQTLHRPRS